MKRHVGESQDSSGGHHRPTDNGKPQNAAEFRETLTRLTRVTKAEMETEERKYKAERKRLKAKKEKRRQD